MDDRTRDDRLADVIEGFLAASESGPPPSRARLLEENPDLADDLVACLETLDFIGNSLGQKPATSVLECGQQFGEYQILRELGRGGMGVVYEAYHLGLERRVALKVLSGSSFEDAKQRARFLQEAKTAAALHHTNIVPIFEVGELDGVCYYAMQFIPGESLGSIVRRLAGRTADGPRHAMTIFPPGTIVRDERTAAGRSEIAATTNGGEFHIPTALTDGPASDRYFRETCRIVAQAADALAHAHMRGIVHRDVKPSNLILDREGRVWITDFGLAFRSDDQQGARDAVGTPAYMSPEQVRPGRAAVDHRTDIYSLGATLYELLTLRPIFEGETSLAVLTQIASVDPVAPRRHNERIPRDLDCIARRAVAKRPDDRYPDAAALASDLRRYLEYEPVHARRISPIGRLVLWCKREPRLAGVTTGAAAILLGLSVLYHWAVLRARNVAVRAREQAEAQLLRTTIAEANATESFRQALFQQARATSLSFQNGRRWRTLDLIQQAQSIKHDAALRDDAITALSIPDARLVRRLTVDKNVERLAFCPARHQIAFSCEDGSVRLWNFEDESPSSDSVALLAASGYEYETVALSACGRYVAALETDGAISVWDTTNRRLTARVELDEFRPRFMAFLADQTTLVALSTDGVCRRWELIDGQLLALDSLDTGRWQVATSGPDPNSVSLTSQSGEIAIWNLVTGTSRTVEGITLNRGRPAAIQWDAYGKQLAVGQRSETVDLWTAGHASPRALGGHHGTVRAAAFHPFGELLATSGTRDSAVKLWDSTTGDLIALLREPLGGSLAISFSSDGKYLAAGGVDKIIWVWEVVSPKSFRRWAAHDDIVTQVAVSPDGTLFASGSADGSVALWPTESPDEPAMLAPREYEAQTRLRPDACAGIMFSPDGRFVASRSRAGSIRVWDVETHELAGQLAAAPNMRGGGAMFLPSGTELLRLSDEKIQRWNLMGNGEPETIGQSKSPLSAMALSSDGEVAALYTTTGHLQLFDVRSREFRGADLKLPALAVAIAIDSERGRVAVGDRGGMVHLVDMKSMAIVSSWKESDDELTSVAFSPDGRWLGVTAQEGVVRLRGMPQGDLVASFAQHEGGARALAFGPRSQRLVTCGDDKLIHVWRLDSLNQELAELGLDW